MKRNPFKPTYGKTPPAVVGIDMLLDGFADAVDNAPGDPEGSMLILDGRGAGKTVALNSLEDVAHEAGWLTVSENSRPGLIERITAAATKLHADTEAGAEPSPTEQTETITTGPASLRRQTTSTRNNTNTPDLRAALEQLTGSLQSSGTGLFITIDEIQDIDPDELRHLGNDIQHLIRADLPVAFAAAGLPSASSLLDTPGSTFLTRAARHTIGRFSAHDVRVGIEQPLTERDVSIDTAALDAAVNATDGYAFMIQLVGYGIWHAATGPRITIDDAHAGIAYARDRVGAAVIEPTWRDLSPADRSFLLAMAVDPGPSAVSELSARLNKNGNHVNQYRRRLEAHGVIERTGRGELDFAHAATRTWLREHQAFNAAGYTSN